jgi:hypothetical protein
MESVSLFNALTDYWTNREKLPIKSRYAPTILADLYKPASKRC